MAGAVMAGLLGGLMAFDAFFVKAEREAPARIATAPIAIQEPKAVEPPAEEKLTPAETPTEPEQTAGSSQPAEVAAEPERSEAPSRTRTPTKGERPLTVPARAQAALMRPSEPAMLAKPTPEKEVARVLPPPAARETTPTRPIAQAIEASRRFLVQIGVFNSVANAEELRAKLELAGIPTQIEARVQVGPFATRQEAEQARDRLKDLGIEPGLVMTARK
jgi:DedD protein